MGGGGSQLFLERSETLLDADLSKKPSSLEMRAKGIWGRGSGEKGSRQFAKRRFVF